MKTTIVSMCAFVMLIAACSGKPRETREQKISSFSDVLFAIVKKGDAAAYQQLWVKPGDQLATSDGKHLAMEIPTNPEAFRRANQVLTDFNALEADISAQLGGKPDAFEKVKYLIQSDPIAKQSGLFKFELQLIVSRNGKVMTLVQPNCVQVERGIVIADMMLVDRSGGQ